MGDRKGELEERSTVSGGWEAGYDKEVPEVVGRLGGGIEVGRRRRMLAMGEVDVHYSWQGLGVKAVIDCGRTHAAGK